jgi:diaminohydroxyphosphoribosylaminopyrimidine deaminase/5-amino-6-(5-phosphoribosylamino)uracil reductase
MATPGSTAMLDLAARLALRGMGRVEPNPMVGAVVARDGRVIGMGHHRVFGGPHAEREALDDCRRRGEDPRGATVYVTLEPCRGAGKQRPCVPALVEAGIARVVIGNADPHGKGAGGADELRARGVSVEFDGSSRWARAVTLPFLKRTRADQPLVIAKWAQTLDGRIATRTGESKWISGKPARRRVHRLRGRVDAILTGLGTVRADDPMLTAREGAPPRRRPARVVIDPELEIWLESRLVKSAAEAPVIVACSERAMTAAPLASKRAHLAEAGVAIPSLPPGTGGLDIAVLLEVLCAQRGVCTVLVEAGPILLGSLFQADLVDVAAVYIAPLVLGDEQARPPASGRVAQTLKEGRHLELLRVRPLGPDIEALYLRA